MKNILMFVLLSVLVSCSTINDNELRNKLYIHIEDENGLPVEKVGLHFFYNFSYPLSKNAAIRDTFHLGRGYEFKQNYPNPFSPSTNIEFALPAKHYVDLKIVDIQDTSSTIKQLISDTLYAGIHMVIWDGTNDDSLSVTNGMYACIFKVDTVWAIRSLLLNTIDPEDFRENNSIPLATSNSNGQIAIDYKYFQTSEQIRLTNGAGEYLGTMNLPSDLNLVFVKDQFQIKTIPVNIDTTKSLELNVTLDKG